LSEALPSQGWQAFFPGVLRPNYFKLQKKEAIAVLTFDRDKKRNPFNEDSLSELEANLVAVRRCVEYCRSDLLQETRTFCQRPIGHLQ